jgi:hypothetical protein
MAPINVPLQLPELYGDLINHPDETWKRDLVDLDLAYAVAGASQDTRRRIRRRKRPTSCKTYGAGPVGILNPIQN